MADYSPAGLAYAQAAAEGGIYGPKALAYYSGRPYISNQLPISQLVSYQQGKAQARTGYETGVAQNEYDKAAASAMYDLNRGNQVRSYEEFTRPNLENQYKQQRDVLSGPFAGRGMLDSGMHHGAQLQHEFEKGQGLGEAAFKQTTALGQMDTEHYIQMGQYNLNQQVLARTYWESMAQIQAQEDAARYDLAAQIRAFA